MVAIAPPRHFLTFDQPARFQPALADFFHAL
jgi:hypothetical protein